MTFFPWIMLLPGAAAAQIRALGGAVPRAFLFAWLIPTFVVMSLVATKLPHYILPIFPALALAVGALVSLPRREFGVHELRWLAIGRWLAITVGMALAVALIAAPWLHLLAAWDLPPRLAKNIARIPALPGLVGPLLASAVILGWMVLLAAQQQRTLRLNAAAATLASAMGVWYVVAAWQALPVLERFKLSKPLAEMIRARTDAGVPVMVCGYDEASLHFYLDRGPIRTLDPSALAAWAAADGSGVLVTTAERWTEAKPIVAAAAVEVIASVDGINVANGSLLHLVAVGRRLPR
ncbi:MAG: hypothetical protein H0W83_13040 [Planctomycetes bacterium]|nr:hypothetical protein [Planctomycetota bacterium]